VSNTRTMSIRIGCPRKVISKQNIFETKLLHKLAEGIGCPANIFLLHKFQLFIENIFEAGINIEFWVTK
jgi:hypothetical protein